VHNLDPCHRADHNRLHTNVFHSLGFEADEPNLTWLPLRSGVAGTHRNYCCLTTVCPSVLSDTEATVNPHQGSAFSVVVPDAPGANRGVPTPRTASTVRLTDWTTQAMMAWAHRADVVADVHAPVPRSTPNSPARAFVRCGS
jgi:hypothetical protein